MSGNPSADRERAGARSSGQTGTAPTATADRLLEAAADLFRQKGYAATTTRELADRLGIQKASLYHHIRGKEDLLFQISVESLRRITVAVGGVAAAEAPERRLEAMIKAHVEAALPDRDMHTTMLVDLRALSPDRQADIIERRNRYERVLRDAIEEDQAAGRLRSDIDARYVTLALLNVLNWTIFWFNPEGPLSPSEVGGMLADIFLNGARG